MKIIYYYYSNLVSLQNCFDDYHLLNDFNSVFSLLSFYVHVRKSWESLPVETATFTSDITPLILAAHRDNYEIIKILLDRGAVLPMPHDVR